MENRKTLISCPCCANGTMALEDEINDFFVNDKTVTVTYTTYKCSVCGVKMASLEQANKLWRKFRDNPDI